MKYILILIVSLSLWACSEQPKEPLSKLQSPSTEKLAKVEQSVHPDSIAVFRGKYTIIAIPAGTFDKPVKITLYEAFSKSDFVRAGLVTESGEQLLASGGMFRLVAEHDGEPVPLNEGAGIYISHYAPQKDSDMQLFAGAQANKQIDWQLTENAEEAFRYDSRSCRDCAKLIRLVKKVRPKVLKKKYPRHRMRYYWKNGTLMFFGSGVVDTIASLNKLKRCEAQLQNCSNAAGMLAQIKELKQEILEQQQKDGARMAMHFYEYRLSKMGWYNLDKYVKEEQILVKGTLQNEEGEPLQGPAIVHLIAKDAKIHQIARTEDGTFELKFVEGRPYTLLAFAGPNMAATVTAEEEKVQLKLKQTSEQQMNKMIAGMD